MTDRRPFVRPDTGRRLLAIHSDAMRATYERADVAENAVYNGVAVVSVDGPLSAKPDFWFTDYESMLDRFRDALFDPSVHSVVLKIDSPGGDAACLNETVLRMIDAKEAAGKPVYAYADEGAYSAAYAIACAADEIYLPEPGGLGSIGVVSAIVSAVEMNKRAGLDVELIYSGDRKVDGNPDAPITDEARAHVQRRVDQLARIYWRLVASSRGMSVSAVRALQADTFYGPEAVEAGLADDVMSLDDVMRYAMRRVA